MLCLYLLYLMVFLAGFDPRGLEHCPFSWDEKDQPLGSALLCGPHDLWQLRPLQLTGGHFGRGIFKPGKLHPLSHSNRDKIESNLSAPAILGYRENVFIRNGEVSIN